MTCKIGKFRHRITIEERSKTSDGMGGYTESWSTLKTVWARVKPTSTRERFFAGKLEDNITHEITMRHTTGIKANQRVSFDSRIFKIKGIINEEEQDKTLKLACEEGSGN